MESQMGHNFQPSDEQIVHFLNKKRLNPHFSHHPIKDIGHICSLEPWDLATESKTESEDQVWYFFYEPYYHYSGARRGTKAGHWTITSRDSKIEARNGLTGTKKFLTFYRRGPYSKAEAKTDWVMHEYHVKDDPSYKKEFVLCRIQKGKRSKKRKHGISTTEEGGSSQQLVSPPQQSLSGHSISNGNRSEEKTHTIPQQQQQNQNSISYPGNPTVQNTISYPQSITNYTPTQLSITNHLISQRDHNDENIPTNLPLLQNHNWISCLGNHSEETTLTYPQQQPSHNWISYPGNCIEQNMPSLKNNWAIPNYSPSHTYPQQLSNIYSISYSGNRIEQGMCHSTYPWVTPTHSPTQQLSYDCFISARNYGAENILINQQPQPNQDLISHFGNQIEEYSSTNPLLPPNINLELQLPLRHPLVTCDFAETFQEECLPIGEFKSYGGHNRLNDASFSSVQTPISQEQELKYSNSSSDDCDSSDSEIYSDEQVNNLINSLRALLDENSREENGKILTPDFNSSKSDGEALAYAQDSSDTNTAYNGAQIENFA